MVTITDADLQKSATTYRKQLLRLPVITAQATLKHMTAIPGLAGRLTVGELSGDIELGPYSSSRTDENGVAIAPRVLETYLGSVIKKFDPNTVSKTVYGSAIAQGKSLETADITRQVLVYLAGKLGSKLNMAIFKAKRNASGTKTEDLFDGFDTITAAEITAGNIATTKKNLYEFGAAISASNAVDSLKAFYRAASDELKDQEVKMFIPHEIYDAYVDDYQATVGAAPYNKEFEKTFLEGSNNLCELVPLSSKKGSDYIHLTTKGNMMFGYGAGLADENLTVEKHHPFKLDFVSTMYFGTQFETISPEKLLVGKLMR